MNNYKLTIQYDGSRYKGWQRLGNSDQTIQGKVEHVLSKLEGKPVEIIGSSRTDAGVHAIAQVANVKLSDNRTAEEVQSYLNRYLPQDISVTAVAVVADRFHARYHTKAKTYVYKIWNASYSHPFMRKYSMHIEKPLSRSNMQKASEYFRGDHDFTTFSNAKSKKKSMVRSVYSIDLTEHGQMIEIRIRGNGFLYNQIRKMVGTLIRIGLGEIDGAKIPSMIEAKDRSLITFMADAAGLYLEEIEFE